MLFCLDVLASFKVVGLSSCSVLALSCVSVLGHIVMHVCTFLCQCSRSYCHVCLHFPVSVFSVVLPCMLQRKGVHCKTAVWALQREVRVDGRSFSSLSLVVLNFFKAPLVTIRGTV